MVDLADFSAAAVSSRSRRHKQRGCAEILSVDKKKQMPFVHGGECASATETGVISRALFFRHVFAAAYKRSIYFQQYSNS